MARSEPPPARVDDPRLNLQLDAEITALRYAVEQLLADRAMATPNPMETIRGLSERISMRLDREELQPTDPYRETRKPLLRLEIERLVVAVAATIDFWTNQDDSDGRGAER